MTNVQPPNELKKPSVDLEELYKIYRDYVKHEDNLINVRLSWNLTVQGFLFAAFGLAALKLVESHGNDALEPRSFSFLAVMIVMLPIMGLLISATSYFGVMAATWAIRALKCRWEEFQGHPEWALLPELTGGGSPKARGVGTLPQMFIPLIFVASWTAFLTGSLIYLLRVAGRL